MTPLRKILNKKGMTVPTLAKKTGIAASYLYKLTCGERVSASWANVARISKVLGEDPFKLFPPYGRR